MQVSSMIQSLSKRRNVLPRTTIDQILAKTDGVPLYVEEITKAVLESVVGGANDGRPDKQSPLLVPDTLRDTADGSFRPTCASQDCSSDCCP